MQERVLKIITSKSKTFLAFCFCFIVGAGVASLFDWTAVKTPASVLPLIGGGNPTTMAADLSPTRGETERGVSFVSSISLYLYISLFLISFIVIIFWNKKIVRFFVLCSLFLTFGVWRFSLTIPNCNDPSIACAYNNRKIEFTGVVSADPDIRIDQARYTIATKEVVGGSVIPTTKEESLSQTQNGQRSFAPLRMTTPVRGKVLITTRLYPQYKYGDRLAVTCKLQAPNNKDDSTFRYDKYLARHGIWSVCSFPRSIVILNEAQRSEESLSQSLNGQRSFAIAQDDSWHVGRKVMQKILQFKFQVQNQINRLWSEPESSLMAGLLYGSRSGLPPSIIDDFNKTGLSHIVAVSGFNVTIIATVLMSLLISLGLWRRQALGVVLAGIIFFVIFTGLSASAVRAGVMAGVVILGQYLGRLSRMGTVLMFTAAVMVFANPYVLMWDAGFQLSFLATLGLVYISPILNFVIPSEPRAKSRGDEKSLSGHNNNGTMKQLNNGLSQRSFAPLRMTVKKIVTWVREPLISTLSAIIATLPLILYQFGRLSLVAPLVNVLILWIVPWLMLFGFIALVTSFILFPLGHVVASVAHVGLAYVIMVIQWFGNQSWSAAQIQLPWWGMVVMYAALFWIIYKAAHSRGSPLLKERDGG